MQKTSMQKIILKVEIQNAQENVSRNNGRFFRLRLQFDQWFKD